MRSPSRRRFLALCTASALVTLAGCASDESAGPSDAAASDGPGGFPVTIKHALGTTVIDRKPRRVATLVWSNHDTALALGAVPVGMPRQTYGDQDGDGVLSWTTKKLADLKAKSAPALFDESDGLDFEAIADTRPDVILAAYSGLSKAEYTTLSEIAPTVAYPETAFGTSWRDTIRLDARALGLSAEGDALVARLEKTIDKAVGRHPGIAGRTALVGYFDPKDFSTVGYYTSHDVRNQFSVDLGMKIPASLAALSAKTDEFYATLSAERADVFDDVDLIVTYGDGKLLGRLQKHPLLGTVPAIARGAVVVIPQNSELAAALSPPTALTIPATTDAYATLLADAAARLP